MSCVLRITGPQLERALRDLTIEPYRVEGDDAHFLVSDSDLGDFTGQVRDAIAFLGSHSQDLERLTALPEVRGILDFGLAWRDVAAQVDSLPAELVRRAAEFGFSIELSHYPVSAENSGGA
ncbi:MAG TPA: hypothetical protein VGS98_10250 [Thermoanaerobaculia bacterium]|jgi:hypothetical protein|nr:hypothetical protein [Thermoanaerobaculia bacterium]